MVREATAGALGGRGATVGAGGQKSLAFHKEIS